MFLSHKSPTDHPRAFTLIGAGLAGLTLAVELARRNFKVTVIYDPLCPLAATKATHGISTIKGILESDAELFGLKLEGHHLFEPWLKELERILRLSRPDGVWISRVLEEFPHMESFRKEFGRIYRKDFIGAKRVSLKLSPEVQFAQAEYPGDWWVDPAYLVTILWKALDAFNVETIEDRVEAIEKQGQKFIIDTQKNGQFHVTNVVISAGAGSPQILKNSKLEGPDLFAVAGYTFKSRFEGKPICLVKGTSGLALSRGYLHWGSTSDGGLKIGQNLNLEILRHRTEIDERRLATDLLSGISQRLDLCKKDLEISTRWGVRVRSRSRAPIFAPIREESFGRIWLNTAYYKSGIILSHLMASRFAEEV